MDAEFVAECRYLIAKGVANGTIIMPAKTEIVAFRSKYRMARSPEDEFEFQKKTVASLKKQLSELSGASMDKVKPIRIKLGMANSRLKKAREAAGLGV
jgi:hypothetical protein